MDTSYCDDSLMGVSIAIMPTQIVLVAGRFYTRRVQEIACTADDYLMIPAVASLPAPRLVGYMFFNTLCFADRKPRSVGIVYSVYDAYCDLISARLTGQVLNIAGLGYQFEYVQQTAPEKLVSLQKGLFACQILNYPFIVTPAKISILLFYNRIFSTSQFRVLSYAVAFILLGTGVGIFFSAIFQCSPVQFAWDKSIKGGTCFNQTAFFRYVSLPQILTDVVILIMPLPFVWKLQTRMMQKVALTGVFLLGGLGVVASILRMTIFFREEILGDPTWVSVNLGIWCVLESAIIRIAACLPPVWPLLGRIRPQRLTRKRDASKRSGRSGEVPGDIPLKRTSNGFSRLGESDGNQGKLGYTDMDNMPGR